MLSNPYLAEELARFRQAELRAAADRDRLARAVLPRRVRVAALAECVRYWRRAWLTGRAAAASNRPAPCLPPAPERSDSPGCVSHGSASTPRWPATVPGNTPSTGPTTAPPGLVATRR